MNQPEEQQPPVGHDMLEIAIATHGEWVRSQYDGTRKKGQQELWEKSVEARADVVAHLRELRRLAMADYRTELRTLIADEHSGRAAECLHLGERLDQLQYDVSDAAAGWRAECDSRYAAKEPTDGAIMSLDRGRAAAVAGLESLAIRIDALAQQVARLDPAAHRSVTFDIPDGFDANALIAEMQQRLKTGVRVDEPDNNGDWFAGHVERTDADKVIAADWEAEQTRVLRLLLGVHPNRLAEENLALRSQASAALMADAGLTEYSPAGQSWMITGKGIDWLNERGV